MAARETWKTVTGGAKGVGLGFRLQYAERILSEEAVSPWFEVLADNFFVEGGSKLAVLDQLRERYPLAIHCVGLNIGGTDPLDAEYLGQLQKLIDRVDPMWVSDHLCWTSFEGRRLNELMPLPFTPEVVRHVAERVRKIQDRLGRRLLIENLSAYASFEDNQMPEWEFLGAIADQADCMILLDVNNIYVSARNIGFDADAYIAGIPAERVGEIHLAGFEDHGTHYLDAHSREISEGVLGLYKKTITHLGPRPTLIEWDDNLPPFGTLKEQAARADRVLQSVPVQKNEVKAVA